MEVASSFRRTRINRSRMVAKGVRRLIGTWQWPRTRTLEVRWLGWRSKITTFKKRADPRCLTRLNPPLEAGQSALSLSLSFPTSVPLPFTLAHFPIFFLSFSFFFAPLFLPLLHPEIPPTAKAVNAVFLQKTAARGNFSISFVQWPSDNWMTKWPIERMLN